MGTWYQLDQVKRASHRCSTTHPQLSVISRAQLNADIRLVRKMTLVVGGGFFGYTQIKGRETVFDPDDGFGNSLNGNEYANDYRLVEGTVGLKFNMLDKPAMVFFDTVLNTAVSRARLGWLAGVKFGKVKKGGDLAARYNYRRIDADAVLGVFTDSDFKGGGTNGAGHEIGVSIGLAQNFQVGVSFFANSLNTTSPTGFYRGQVDFTIRI